MAKVRDVNQFHDGFEDGLEPVEAIDLNLCKTVDDIVRAMSRSSFGARNLGEATDVLEEMFRDEKCYTVLTLSGALTVAKMQLIFVELIERKWVNAIISTGALIAHGFIEGTGMHHFKYKWDLDDQQLYGKGYDRVYDTLELEKNLHEASLLMDDIFAHKKYDGVSMTSPKICRTIGQYLVDNEIGGRSVLKSAYLHDVPIYIPALSDSELGLDLLSLRYPSKTRKRAFNPTIEHSSLADIDHFARQVEEQQHLGIFTLGGGVPRNWAQQIGPFIELKKEVESVSNAEFSRYRYGVRICPEPVHWGGLSGCTYSEGMSWGKFVPEGRFAEVLIDATVAVPFMIRALMERFDNKK
jgi:deoxyhypusine synthase